MKDNYEFAKLNISRGIWRHFKGNHYRVLGFARDCDNPGKTLVYYQALYGDKGYWVRPLLEFTEFVTRDNYSGPRFKKVHASDMGLWRWLKYITYEFFEPAMFWRPRI